MHPDRTSARAYATEQEERILIERRVAQARTFDARPCLGSELDDLSLPLFLIDYRQQAITPEIIEENQRSVEQQLASLRFFDSSISTGVAQPTQGFWRESSPEPPAAASGTTEDRC